MENMLLGHGFGLRFLSDELSISGEKNLNWIPQNIGIGILQQSAYTRKTKYRTLNEQRAFNEVATSEYMYMVEQFEKAQKLIDMGGDKRFIDFTALFDEDKIQRVVLSVCTDSFKGTD